MKQQTRCDSPGTFARQFHDGQVWWQALGSRLCWKRWTIRWGLGGWACKIFLLIKQNICSGRGDRHRWVSFPIPPSFQECDAVKNLSNDGDQLQVWPSPFGGELMRLFMAEYQRFANLFAIHHLCFRTDPDEEQPWWRRSWKAKEKTDFSWATWLNWLVV